MSVVDRVQCLFFLVPASAAYKLQTDKKYYYGLCKSLTNVIVSAFVFVFIPIIIVGRRADGRNRLHRGEIALFVSTF